MIEHFTLLVAPNPH